MEQAPQDGDGPPLRLKSILRTLDDPSSRAGRRFALGVQAMIVLSLVSFSLETLPGLSPTVRELLAAFEGVSVMLFTAEYLLRVVAARRPLRFIFSFFGLVDLAAILPFYLTLGFDLRSLRTVRLLRLFRLFKLVRYSVAIRRMTRALRIAREELVLFSAVTAVLLYASAVGLYYFERGAQPEAFASIFHSLWWAIVTLTTVGYGDVYPVTVGGRVFTSAILLLGLGIVAVPTGILASALSKARAVEREEEASSRV